MKNTTTKAPSRAHKAKDLNVKKKVVVITAILVPESLEKTDEGLEADIRKELSPTDIPWVARIEKVKVSSGD